MTNTIGLMTSTAAGYRSRGLRASRHPIDTISCPSTLFNRTSSVLRTGASCCWDSAANSQAMFVVDLFGLYGCMTTIGRFKRCNQPFPQTQVSGDSMRRVEMTIHNAFMPFATAGGLPQETTRAHRLCPRVDREKACAY